MTKVYSLQERIVKGGVTTIVLTIFGSIFAYLIRILYSRTLSIEDYGLFYAVFGFVTLVMAYVDLGFGYSIVYLLPKYLKLKDYSKAWNIFIYGQIISLGMSAIISFFLILGAPFLAKYYFRVPGSENVIYMFCFYGITYSIISGLVQIYSGFQKEKYYSLITVFRWSFTFVFSIMFFFFDSSNVLFYSIAWSIGHILTAVIFIWLLYYKHAYLTDNKIYWSKDLFKQMYVLALPSLLTTLIGSLVVFTDSLFLTLFRGLKEVGIYNVVYPVASISVVLLNPINIFVLPLVSHLMVDKKEKIKLLVNKIMEVVPFIGVYFALFIILFPSSVATLLFGQKWLGLIEVPMSLLAVAFVILPLASLLEVVLLGVGMVKERLKMVILINFANLALNGLLIWQYGIFGVVFTKIIVTMLSVVLFIHILKPVVFIKVPILFYSKILFVSLIIFISCKILGLYPRNILEYISMGLVYSIFFIIAGYYLKVFDYNLLKQLFNRTS